MATTLQAPTADNLMYPHLSPSENLLLERVHEFVDKDVLPHTREWDTHRAFPADIFKRLGDLGILGLTLPPSMGNSGTSCAAYVEICRVLAQGDPALAMNVAAINALCVAHFPAFATEQQIDKYLAGVVRGEIRMAWGLTEPDAGSDARRVKTVAEPIEGKPGFFHLNGKKMFITNGGNADLIIVIARVSPTELTAFFVETDQPGFKLGERIPTVGVCASYTSQFTLNNAIGWHTPCQFEQAIGLLYRGRLGIAAMALGIAEKALDLALAYSKQREQFNRRLCDMQSVQNMLADSGMEIEAARLLLRQGAAKFDRGESVVLESSYAKLYASETANRVTNRAIQIHGGRGMTPEFLVEKLWRDAKLTEIGEGCSEIQRMVISKQLLK